MNGPVTVADVADAGAPKARRRVTLRRMFLDHPASVDETYARHMRVAAGFGLAMFVGAMGCLVHALVPAFHQRTGSRTIKRLHQRLHHDPSRDGKRPEYEI